MKFPHLTTGRSVFYDPFVGLKNSTDIRFELERKLVACLATGGSNGYPVQPYRIHNPHFRSLICEGMSKPSWSIQDLINCKGNLAGAASLALSATLEKPMWGQSDFLTFEPLERLEMFAAASLTEGLTL